jgi:hypothetical protein
LYHKRLKSVFAVTKNTKNRRAARVATSTGGETASSGVSKIGSQNPTKTHPKIDEPNLASTSHLLDTTHCLLDRLVFLRKKIREKEEIFISCQVQLQNSSLRSDQRILLHNQRHRAETSLRGYRDEFWKINCPEPEERCRRQIQEYFDFEAKRLARLTTPNGKRQSVSLLLLDPQ